VNKLMIKKKKPFNLANMILIKDPF